MQKRNLKIVFSCFICISILFILCGQNPPIEQKRTTEDAINQNILDTYKQNTTDKQTSNYILN